VKSWIEVSAERLAANYRATLSVVEQEANSAAALLAVIKANGYGHGATVCAPVLTQAGAEWLGVTDASEGAAVRGALAKAGIVDAHQPKILIMCGHLPTDADSVVRHRLTSVVWTIEQMEALAAAAGPSPLAVHIEIDSGMTRQGVGIAGLPKLLEWLSDEPSLELDGVMTHFASAEVAGSDQTQAQRKRFEQAVQLVAQWKLRPAWMHVGNTSAIDNAADGGTIPWLTRLAKTVGARAMVREGLGLYGYCLPLEGLVAADGDASRLPSLIQPVMTWKTHILDVQDAVPGAKIGYSGTFIADRPMRLALLPVGYADGLRRELSSSTGSTGGWVVIAGQRAPIVGRISMNLTTINVTAIDSVAIGDEVVVLGEGSTANDHAAIAGTIAYEILCGMRAPVVLV
jgi:alanine racemase